MFAIISTGGKQYKVSENTMLSVSKIDGKDGDKITIDDVLFACDKEQFSVGSPQISGAKVNAEIVKATGTYKHLGDKTKNESCKIALERAKKEAIIKTLGETVSSEIVSNCSEVDWEYNCERNQFSLLELKGDLSGTQTLSNEFKV